MGDLSQDYMNLALEEAKAAAERGEVPVGAVIVDKDGKVIAKSGNRVEEFADSTAHAEILVIRHASAFLRSSRLKDCDLYVTLEPCCMCAGAISFARLRKVIFGAYDPKGGAVEHGPRFYTQNTCHHRPEVIGGIQETECAALLKEFFEELRD